MLITNLFVGVGHGELFPQLSEGVTLPGVDGLVLDAVQNVPEELDPPVLRLWHRWLGDRNRAAAEFGGTISLFTSVRALRQQGPGKIGSRITATG